MKPGVKGVLPMDRDSTAESRRFKVPLCLLLLLVGMRLGMVLAYPFLAEHSPAWAWANNDGYDTIAVNWVETGVVSLEAGVPTALRLPLYPALIAAAVVVAPGAYLWVVMGLQALLSIATGVLLFRLTAGLWNRRVAMIALVVFIFHPQVNNFVFRCATETLYIFLLMGLIHQAVLFLRIRKLAPLLGAALAMGLSLLTRQTLVPLAWLSLLVLLIWCIRGREQWRLRLAWTAAAVATVALVLAPWLVRNGRQCDGKWVLQTWVGQPLCQGAYVSRHLDAFLSGQKSLTDLDQTCLTEIGLLERRIAATLPTDLSPIAREVAFDQAFRARARDLAARAPWDRLRQTVRNLLWTPVLQMTWRSTRILMCIQWPLLLFGLWGSLLAVWKDPRVPWEAWPVWVLMGYLWAAHALAWPQARYLLPGLVPFLAFAAFGLEQGVSAALEAVRSPQAPHPPSG